MQEFFVCGASRPLGNREGRTKNAGCFKHPKCMSQNVDNAWKALKKGAFTPKKAYKAEKFGRHKVFYLVAAVFLF